MLLALEILLLLAIALIYEALWVNLDFITKLL